MSPETLYEHVNTFARLLGDLAEKSTIVGLGPADGRLYMQLCDTLNEYTKNLERTFREGNDESERNSNRGTKTDSGPEGNRPSDSDA